MFLESSKQQRRGLRDFIYSDKIVLDHELYKRQVTADTSRMGKGNIELVRVCGGSPVVRAATRFFHLKYVVSDFDIVSATSKARPQASDHLVLGYAVEAVPGRP